MTTGTFFATAGSAASFVGAGHTVTTYNVAMVDGVVSSDGVTPISALMAYAVAAADALLLTTNYPVIGIGVKLVDGMNFHGAPSYIWLPGGAVLETITVGDKASVTWRHFSRMSASFQIGHSQVLSVMAAVTEGFTLSPVLQAFVGTVLLNRILVGDVPVAQVKYATTLAQGFTLAAILQRFVGATVTDGVLMGVSASAQYQAIAQLVDLMTFSVGLRATLAFNLTVADGVEMDAESLLQAIYTQTLTEVINLDILYQEPNGSLTAWMVNTRTGAVTEYQNWAFNSFVQIGNKYVAAAPDGIYELNGDTDNGIKTVADFMGGFLQPAGPHLSGLKGVYLGQSGTGYWLLKLDTGDGREYIYQRLSNPGLMTTKFIIGKGLNSRYVGWELINVEGQDFDLDTIEFIPMVRERRI